MFLEEATEVLTDYQQVINYIVSLLPSITAILSLVGSIVYVFRKTGNISSDTVRQINDLADSIRESNSDANEESKRLRADIKALSLENADLKKQVEQLVKNTSRVRK